MYLLPAGLRVAQPCRYCFYSLAQKWGFRPAGATRCPDKRESWHGGGPLPVSTFTFIGSKCGNTASKTVKISNFGNKFVPQGRLVCNISTKFSAFNFLVWSLSRDKHPSYKHFPAVGEFSHKFSIGPSAAAKLLIGSKKLCGCKNGTDLLYHHAKCGGDRRLRAGCRQKSVMFLFLIVFYVTLWNYEVCDNGNAMKLCNFQNSYGTIA